MNRFDVKSGKLFLTYPECLLEKSSVLEQLQLKLSIAHYIIARELHANGHYHIHAYIELTETQRFRDARFADLLLGDVVFHGNYQGCRSTKKVMQYVTKDEDYISDLDVAGLLTGNKSSRALICDQLLKEDNLEDLVLKHPQLLYDYEKLKRSYLLFKENTTPPVQVPSHLPNPWGCLLPYPGNGKKRHWWIWSKQPNKGKTQHFAKPLRDNYGFVIATGEFTHWNIDSRTPGIVLDDYNHARLKYDSLNQLADGTYNFRVAYRGVVQISNQFIVIVCSNQPIRSLYPNMYELLEARYNELNVD